MYGSGQIGLWSVVEEGIGIVAGSIPALRPLLSLRILGGSTQRSNGGSASTAVALHTNEAGRLPAKSIEAVELGTVRSSGKNTTTEGWSDDGDGDSQKHILVRTQVVVSTEHTARDGRPRQKNNASDTELWTQAQQNKLGLESQTRNKIKGGN